MPKRTYKKLGRVKLVDFVIGDAAYFYLDELYCKPVEDIKKELNVEQIVDVKFNGGVGFSVDASVNPLSVWFGPDHIRLSDLIQSRGEFYHGFLSEAAMNCYDRAFHDQEGDLLVSRPIRLMVDGRTVRLDVKDIVRVESDEDGIYHTTFFENLSFVARGSVQYGGTIRRDTPDKIRAYLDSWSMENFDSSDRRHKGIIEGIETPRIKMPP